MGWLITLGVLAGIFLVPLGIHVKYDADGPLIKVILGPLRFLVYPKPKKQPKQKKKKEKPQQKSAKSQPPGKTAEKKTAGGSLTDFLPLLRVVLDFLVDFRRKIRVNYLQLHLILAGDDPCDLAVNYGRTWAAAGGLITQLERFFIIKKRSVEVACDFTAEKTLVNARLDLTITVGRLLSMAGVHGFRAIKELLSIRNKRKGGAKL